jgi:hypothetical protein
MCAMAVTEPDYGSDVANVRVAARPDADGWRINGVKTWCTFGGRADVLMVLARTDPDRSKLHRGLSVFIVPKARVDGHSFELTQPDGGRMEGRRHLQRVDTADVAAPDVPARQAAPEAHPAVPGLGAVLTHRLRDRKSSRTSPTCSLGAATSARHAELARDPAEVLRTTDRRFLLDASASEVGQHTLAGDDTQSCAPAPNSRLLRPTIAVVRARPDNVLVGRPERA